MWQGSIAVVENFLLQDCWWCNANMSETICASSAILPNLTSATVDRKVAQLSRRLTDSSVDPRTHWLVTLLRYCTRLHTCRIAYFQTSTNYDFISPYAAVAWPVRYVVGPVSIHGQHTLFFSAQNDTWTDFSSSASPFSVGDQSVVLRIIYPSSIVSNLSDWQLR
jgi:hypothetical protein